MRNMEERGPTWKLEGRDGDKTWGSGERKGSNIFRGEQETSFHIFFFLAKESVPGLISIIMNMIHTTEM